MLALAGCDGAVPRAGERQPSPPPVLSVPVHMPARAPTPVARPYASAVPIVTSDWRDVALPAGDWTWATRPGGSVAQFGTAGQLPIAMIVCDRTTAMVRIALPADSSQFQSATSQPATLTSSTSSSSVVAQPQTIDGLASMAIGLPVSDRMLDAMAFSRGRFRVAITGMSAVVLPSWSEVGRVVEDCRG